MLADGRQKGRRGIHRIDPQLGRIDAVIECAALRSRAFFQNVGQLLLAGGLQFRIAAAVGRGHERFANHRSVGGATVGIDDAESAVGRLPKSRVFGEQINQVVFAQLQTGLGRDALLPRRPLHGEHGPFHSFDEFIASRDAFSARAAICGPAVAQPATPKAAVDFQIKSRRLTNSLDSYQCRNNAQSPSRRNSVSLAQRAVAQPQSGSPARAAAALKDCLNVLTSLCTYFSEVCP